MTGEQNTQGKLVSRLVALLFMAAALAGSFAMLSTGERSLFADEAPTQTAMTQ